MLTYVKNSKKINKNTKYLGGEQYEKY